MPKYSETHHLNVDDAGLASVHVAVHLQDADPRIARLLVLRVLDAAAVVADAPERGILGQVVRPQTSGPCVHLDQATDDDLDEVRALGYACEQPDGECPHIEAPDVLCPIKDACYAMRAVARLREVCEEEPEEQDANMVPAAARAVVLSPTEMEALLGLDPGPMPEPEYLHTYETAAPEWVEPEPEEAPVYTTPARPKGRAPAHVKEWTAEEDAAFAGAKSRQDALARFRERFQNSARTDAAIMKRWYVVRKTGLIPNPALPDFPGDQCPITQCVEEEPIAAGDRVALVKDPALVGEVIFRRNHSASVQFPGGGPARVYNLTELRRVVE